MPAPRAPGPASQKGGDAMSDDALLRRVQALEGDNARLRRLLERHGSSGGLRHQVQNTLAMVRDVVRQSAERFEGADDFAAHLEARLDAVFRIQNTIANGLLDGVALDTLVTDELLAHAASEGGRLSVGGPDVLLQPAAAGALALAIHELATNAVKFGALSGPAGRVAVSWTVGPGAGGQPTLTLRWDESGVDAVPRPARRGFGSEVIERALKHQFGGEGTLDFAAGGLRCTLSLPWEPWIGSLGKGA